VILGAGGDRARADRLAVGSREDQHRRLQRGGADARERLEPLACDVEVEDDAVGGLAPQPGHRLADVGRVRESEAPGRRVGEEGAGRAGAILDDEHAQQRLGAALRAGGDGAAHLCTQCCTGIRIIMDCGTDVRSLYPSAG
jgi:hypothetical protein